MIGHHKVSTQKEPSRTVPVMVHVNRLVKQVHTYLGLLNLTILLVFGLTGMIFMVRAVQPAPQAEVRHEVLRIPGELRSEAEIADFLRHELGIAMVHQNIRRDQDNNLVFDFGTHRGGVRVVPLPGEDRVRIEKRQRDVGHFIGMIHATAQTGAKDWRVRHWGYYVEFSIWALIAMAVSGLYLWLVSRPRFLWAQFAFWSGSGLFLALWFLTR